ncbi:MAG: hypothetical protein LBI92_05210 [Azoarcus sp.]|nr:hypothetical protein [Azoarcus sp.]
MFAPANRPRRFPGAGGFFWIARAVSPPSPNLAAHGGARHGTKGIVGRH